MPALTFWTACTAALGLTAGTPLKRHELKNRDSTGCGMTHNEGFNNGTANHCIESGGYTRTYAVNVPDGYNDNTEKKWPLIIDYHGKLPSSCNGGTPYQQYDNSQYYKYSAGQEYLVVYPQGYNGSWQGPSYAVKGVDDLQFTTDLLAKMRTKYCIDDNRVYASGKSNGGGFVDTLACSDNGDEFAAFAMASAALYTDTREGSCTKKRAVLESHGDEDSTIPYHPTKDGSGGPLPDIDKWVSWWGQRTCGSGAMPVNSGDLGGYNTTCYSCGDYSDVISHYQIFDLGHCWPSSTSSNWDASDHYDQTTRKCLDKALDYTPVVLDFFGKWNLANAP
ncbi:hypothetical protein AC579_3057 [Pseudocercospora musae]|uniref:feruloyl esterase n=1 Tax=Pseudocercospora musae TaxID=113226 RepID=A0A139IK52_9PEZI|nr:hypothetical protein AC579_3057 [Pseudocercospora musae]